MLRPSRFVPRSLIVALTALLSSLANSQPLYQEQTLTVRDLPTLMARTTDPSDVLLTSLDTIFHNRTICCGRNSALEDDAQKADPKSLKDVANRLGGRHLLADGRPIMVTTDFLAADTVGAGTLVKAMLDHHAALIEWNSHIYVVHGIVFVWTNDYAPDGSTGAETPIVRKLLLWDIRYSDARREVVFDREKEDATKVQGLLFAKWAPQ